MKKNSLLVLGGGGVVAIILWIWTGAAALFDFFGLIGTLKDLSSEDSSIVWAIKWLVKAPTWVIGLCAVFLTCVFSYTLIRVGKQSAETPEAVETHLRLQFNQIGVLPVALDQENVRNWYAHYNHFELAYLPPATKKNQPVAPVTEVVRAWAVFVLFARPTLVKQVVVEANGGNIPLYEIKQQSDRYFIVSFSGDLVGVVVNFKVRV